MRNELSSGFRLIMSAILVSSSGFSSSENYSPFIPQKAIEVTLQAINNDAMEDVIRDKGKDPFTYLSMLIRKHSLVEDKGLVLGLGEYHTDPSTGKFADEIIEYLAEQGLIQFLAIEAEIDLKEDVEVYSKTGKITHNLEHEYFSWHTRAHFNAIETARKKGLTLIPVALKMNTSPRSYYETNQNGSTQYMADKLSEYTSLHPKESGILFVGDMHIPNFGDCYGVGNYFGIFTHSKEAFPESPLYQFYRSRHDDPVLITPPPFELRGKVPNIEVPVSNYSCSFNMVSGLLFLPH